MVAMGESITRLGRNQLIGTLLVVFAFVMISPYVPLFGELIAFEPDTTATLLALRIIILVSMGTMVGFAIEAFIATWGDEILCWFFFWRCKKSRQSERYRENIKTIRKILREVFPFKEPSYWIEKGDNADEYVNTHRAAFYIAQEIGPKNTASPLSISPIRFLESAKFYALMFLIFSAVFVSSVTATGLKPDVIQVVVLIPSIVLAVIFFKTPISLYCRYVEETAYLLVRHFAEVQKADEKEQQAMDLRSEEIGLMQEDLEIKREDVAIRERSLETEERLRERELNLREREVEAVEKEVTLKEAEMKQQERNLSKELQEIRMKKKRLEEERQKADLKKEEVEKKQLKEAERPKPFIRIGVPNPGGLIWKNYSIIITNVGRGVAKNVVVSYFYKLTDGSKGSDRYRVTALGPNQTDTELILDWRWTRVIYLNVLVSYSDEDLKPCKEEELEISF
jgi:hypothetical protein